VGQYWCSNKEFLDFFKGSVASVVLAERYLLFRQIKKQLRDIREFWNKDSIEVGEPNKCSDGFH
jgi:hypothetical protein